MATAASLCIHFKLGHCKYGDTCRLQHIKELCEKRECDVTSCSLRHPRQCRSWRGYYGCKFGNDCSYLHKADDNYSKKFDTIDKEMRVIKVNIESVEKKMSEKEIEIAKVTKDEILEYIERRLSNEIEHLQRKIEEALKENGVTTMDDEQEKSPGFNTEGDSGMDANSQGSPDGNNEEDKSDKKIRKKKRKKKNNKKNDRSRQISEIGICDDSQVTQFDSGVTSSMFENLGASPLFENNESDENENDEKDESIWLCLCCHTVGGFDTEVELIAHHIISHNSEYEDCYLCRIEAPNNGLEYDEANDSFLKRVESAPSSTEIGTAGNQLKTRGRNLGTTWSSEDCTAHTGVLILGTPADAQGGQGDDYGV